MVQNASGYHCICHVPMFHKARNSTRAWSGEPLLFSCWRVVTGTGEHGPDGRPCAICTLRSLRRIQRWSVADLSVPTLPAPLFFCLVPGSAYFVVRPMRLLIHHHRRQHIPLFSIQRSTFCCSKGRCILVCNSDVSFMLFQKIIQMVLF